MHSLRGLKDRLANLFGPENWSGVYYLINVFSQELCACSLMVEMSGRLTERGFWERVLKPSQQRLSRGQWCSLGLLAPVNYWVGRKSTRSSMDPLNHSLFTLHPLKPPSSSFPWTCSHSLDRCTSAWSSQGHLSLDPPSYLETLLPLVCWTVLFLTLLCFSYLDSLKALLSMPIHTCWCLWSSIYGPVPSAHLWGRCRTRSSALNHQWLPNLPWQLLPLIQMGLLTQVSHRHPIQCVP